MLQQRTAWWYQPSTLEEMEEALPGVRAAYQRSMRGLAWQGSSWEDEQHQQHHGYAVVGLGSTVLVVKENPVPAGARYGGWGYPATGWLVVVLGQVVAHWHRKGQAQGHVHELLGLC